MYRDFSNSYEDLLLRLVKEVEDEQINDATDFIGDVYLTFDSWFGKLKIKNYLNNVQNYHKKILDKNDTTKKEIKDIFTRVRIIDAEVARIFSVYSAFLNRSLEYIDTLSSIVSPSNGLFTSNNIETKLGEQAEALNEIEKVITIYALQNSPDLRAYDNTKRFIDSRNTRRDEVLYGLSRNWFDTFKGVFKGEIGFDSSTDKAYKNTIAKLIDSYIKKNVDFSVSKKVAGYFSDYVHGSKEICGDLAGILTEEGYELSEFSALLDNNCIEIVDGLVEQSPAIIENLEFIFNDYTQSIAVLVEIRQGLLLVDGNDMAIDYINSLISDYNYKLVTVLNNAAEICIDKSIDAAFDFLSTVATGGLLKLAIDAQGLIFNLTGATSKGDKLAEIYISNQYSSDLVSVYEHYLEKIRTGDYTQDDVEKCRHFFELAKEAKIQEYRNIIEFSDDNSKEILEEEIERLEDLSWGFYI